MTRFARALWCSPPLNSGRGAAPPASSPLSPSSCASATPPSPPPTCQSASRRDGRNGCGCLAIQLSLYSFVSPLCPLGLGGEEHPSRHEHELVAVEQHPAGV